MKKEIEKKKIIEDTYLAAYLSLRGYQFQPLLRDNRVAFVFEDSQEIEEEIEALFLNPKIPILTYINQLKALRNLIFNLKGG